MLSAAPAVPTALPPTHPPRSQGKPHKQGKHHWKPVGQVKAKLLENGSSVAVEKKTKIPFSPDTPLRETLDKSIRTLVEKVVPTMTTVGPGRRLSNATEFMIDVVFETEAGEEAAANSDLHATSSSTQTKNQLDNDSGNGVDHKDIEAEEKEFVDYPFYVVDLGLVARKYAQWTRLFPRIRPFYAVKCNPDPGVVKTLAIVNTGFDCASKAEIAQVLEQGVDTSRIVYANPCKAIPEIRYAREKGVAVMTFDNTEELFKLKQYFPECQLILRIRVEDSHSHIPLGKKFGAELADCEELIRTIQTLKLKLIGVSFHVGSGCSDANAYAGAIQNARHVFDLALKILGVPLELLDIGGGFPGTDDHGVSIEDIACIINPLLDKFFPAQPGLRIISEPGRFFVEASHTLCVEIIAKDNLLTNTLDENRHNSVPSSLAGSRLLTPLRSPALSASTTPSHTTRPSLNSTSFPNLQLDDSNSSDEDRKQSKERPNMLQRTVSGDKDEDGDGNDNVTALPAIDELILQSRIPTQPQSQLSPLSIGNTEPLGVTTQEDASSDNINSDGISRAEAEKMDVKESKTELKEKSEKQKEEKEGVEEEPAFFYFINEGVYGSFKDCVLVQEKFTPKVLWSKRIYDATASTQSRIDNIHHMKNMIQKSQMTPSEGQLTTTTTTAAQKQDPNYLSRIYGPSSHQLDCVTQAVQLPELDVGDWLYFTRMGAYTISLASCYDGYKKPNMLYIWTEFEDEIPQQHNQQKPAKTNPRQGAQRKKKKNRVRRRGAGGEK